MIQACKSFFARLPVQVVLLVAATAVWNLIGLVFFELAVVGFIFVSGMAPLAAWSESYSRWFCAIIAFLSWLATAIVFYIYLPLRLSGSIDLFVIIVGVGLLALLYIAGFLVGLFGLFINVKFTRH